MAKNELRQRVKPQSKPRGALLADGDDPNWPYAKGKLDPLGKLIGLSVCVITITLIAYFRYQQHLKDLIITPLDSPRVIPYNHSLPTVNPERFWGTYRSQAYFGMKARSKTSPVFGLMWMTQLTQEMPPPLRHWCDQGDKLKGYGWLQHDGLTFGRQNIEESLYTVKTDFVKRPGGDHGGDWTARVTFEPKNPASPAIVSSFFYAALDGDTGNLEPTFAKGVLKSVKGQHKDLGQFELLFADERQGEEKYSYFVSHARQLDQLKDVMMGGMRVEAWDKARTMPYFNLNGRKVPRDVPGPNFIVKQVTAKLPFTIEVAYQSASFVDRENSLVGNAFTSQLDSKVNAYNSKFESLFGLKSRGYSDKEVDFAMAALSNMLGSIGYFYGSSLVQSKYNTEAVSYWEAPLFTGVPSRPFFPRGFLWDEGFHNLLISLWDKEISKDIIGHWMDLMNSQGWIPREQILGAEARVRVPAEFVVQRNTNANPPTFFLPLQKLIKDMIKSGTPGDKAYLAALYPRLKTWFDYYNTTQTGSQPFTYRWHGRDPTVTKQLNPLTLASGLDDYPRASHPTDEERHVDLRCWIALAAGVMADIAQSVGEEWEGYADTHRILSDNKLLDSLHWSPKGQMYSDYGLHTDKAKLEKPRPPANSQPQQMNLDKVRVIQEEPMYRFVNALGYVSLFPFMLRVIEPNSPKLNLILADIKNPQRLWTDYGLRSISRNSRFYGRYNSEHDPPYWRGPIWINMNYLCLSALHHYSTVSGPHQNEAKSIYADLKKNLVSNIMKEYHRTGYIWENYHDKTGEGKGSHPFTGWSSLVVLIMAEKF